MSEPVLVDRRDGVATITLNRPESYNALNVLTRLLLLDALRSADEDPDTRAVVLTGAGKGFCVGQDLSEIDPTKSVSERFQALPDQYMPIAGALARMTKPVIAAVNGAAAGAGMSLALGADLRIAAEKATFTTAFAAIGLTPDTGMAWYLPRLVGMTKAAELLMLSPSLSAGEALELGLITQVVPAEELAATAHALAARLAAGPTVSFGGIRRLLQFSADHDLDETMALEHTVIQEAGGTRDHAEAVQAFLAKRKPEFTGR